MLGSGAQVPVETLGESVETGVAGGEVGHWCLIALARLQHDFGRAQQLTSSDDLHGVGATVGAVTGVRTPTQVYRPHLARPVGRFADGGDEQVVASCPLRPRRVCRTLEPRGARAVCGIFSFVQRPANSVMWSIDLGVGSVASSQSMDTAPGAVLVTACRTVTTPPASISMWDSRSRLTSWPTPSEEPTSSAWTARVLAVESMSTILQRGKTGRPARRGQEARAAGPSIGFLRQDGQLPSGIEIAASGLPTHCNRQVDQVFLRQLAQVGTPVQHGGQSLRGKLQDHRDSGSTQHTELRTVCHIKGLTCID